MSETYAADFARAGNPPCPRRRQRDRRVMAGPGLFRKGSHIFDLPDVFPKIGQGRRVKTLRTYRLRWLAGVVLAGAAIALYEGLMPHALASSGPFTTVTVEGTSREEVVPDEAVVTLGVQDSAASAQEALARNNTVVKNVLGRIEQDGIPSRDIATSNFNVFPRYRNGGTAIDGYQVSNQLTVTVANVSAVGKIIDQAVSLGANQVDGVQLVVQNRSGAYQKAYKNALANASARARALALALHESVLGIVSINTVPEQNQFGARMPFFAQASSSDGVAIMPGQQPTSVTVEVVYRLGH